MKLFGEALLSAIVCFIVLYVAPFWGVVLATFCVGAARGQDGARSFLASFMGVGLLWFGMAFYFDWRTASMLGRKIGQMFGASPLTLCCISGFLGGLLGGLGATTGVFFKRLWKTT